MSIATKHRGFTLIELLIVVAIIAILAAIAVPNFLEAQIRAKCSRARNDLRTLAVALEAYRTDDNVYPINPFYPEADRWRIRNAHGWQRPMGETFDTEYGIWFILTTPIAYISSIPKDPMWRLYNEQWGIWRDYYRIWNLEGHKSRALNNAWGAPGTVYLARHGLSILTCSVGPDGVEDCADGTQPGTWDGVPGIIPYDPTNGTVSWGDIYYGLPSIGFDPIWNMSR